MGSRRPSPSASISSATARIRTPSSVSFSSSPVFTVSPVTTRLSVFCHQPGDTRAPPPAPWSHGCGQLHQGLIHRRWLKRIDAYEESDHKTHSRNLLPKKKKKNPPKNFFKKKKKKKKKK